MPLREKNKHAGQIETHVQRPIILSTDEELKFEADKLELEINETVDTYSDEFLGALLSAAVEAIREFTRQPARHQFSEHEVPLRPPLQAPKTPAPYS